MSDVNEARILAYYNKPNYQVITTFRGEEAWSNIVQIRYQAGKSRTRVKKAFRNYDKANALLIVYIITQGINRIRVGANYYMNKTDPITTAENYGEGIINMFNELPYEALALPDAPKILKMVL